MAPAAAAAAAPEAPGFAVVVLYNQPKDTAAFEKYYAAKHLPLVNAKAKEIGFSKAVLIKFASNADGSKPAHYREAQLWWPTEAALKAGMATEGFKAVAGDSEEFLDGRPDRSHRRRDALAALWRPCVRRDAWSLPPSPYHEDRRTQHAQRLAHRRAAARDPRARPPAIPLPYESLVARLGAHASGAPKLGASAPDLFECDAVLARIIPNGSLEQIIYRVDALHWLEDAGVAVLNPPRAIERTVDKFYTSALLERAGLATPQTVVCERVEDAAAAFRTDGRRHRQAAVRLDGTRHGARER